MKYLKNIKNEKGVAIVFTLGILGLLTVMALGFASTALMNGKLAKNVSSDTYAKSMAKNLALSQAFYTLEYVNQEPWTRNFGRIYSYESPAADNAQNMADCLWKFNSNVNWVNLFAYPANNNPLNNVTWRYVRDTSSTPQRIVGRYAYVVVPDRGRLSPNIHVGRTPDDNATREQYPSQVISFRTDNESTPASSNSLSSVITPGSRTDFRCATFYDFYRRANITNASYRDWFEQYGINIAPLPRSREAYMGRNGTYYERFNMNRTDWDTMTVAQLMGLTTDESAVNTVNEVEFDANTDGTQQLGYIPLLREMWQSASGNTTLQNRYKQIAANIIQYNRSADAAIVADPAHPLANCLDSDTTNVPAYMGIGRHPMLNEIGMYIRVNAGVTSRQTATGDDEAWEYTPYYNISLVPGAELISPYRLSDSDLNGRTYRVQFFGSLSITVGGTNSGSYSTFLGIGGHNRPFRGSNNSTPYSTITTTINMDNSSNRVILELNPDTSFRTEGVLNNPLYTSSNYFWYDINAPENPIPQTNLTGGSTPNLNVFTYTGSEQSEALFARYMRVTNVSFNVTKVVLYCEDQIVDMCVLSPVSQDISTSSAYAWYSGLDSFDRTRYYFLSYQARSPFVKLQAGNWVSSGIQTRAIQNTDTTPIEDMVTYYNGIGGTAGAVNSDLGTGCPVTDPAYGSTQLPFAFMRQGSMQSFAEFACIHSGTGWNTLDLTQKPLAFDPAASDATAYPSYDTDAPPFGAIFDQVKFSSERYNYGQINANTDSHAALFALLDYARNNTRTGLTTVTEQTNDIMQAGTQGENNMGLNFCLPQPTDYSGADTCAACAIRTATTRQNYLFRNRGDLLLNNAVPNENNLIGYNATTYSSLTTDLPNIYSRLSSGANQTERNLLVAQIMPYLRTDPVDSAYIIVLAQSIQDVGGVNIFADWNRDGEYSSTPVTVDDTIRRRLGFRYTNLSGTEADLPNAPTTINETFLPADTQLGRYDLGADKITGEAKLIAKVVRDGITGKWRIVEIRYVE